jgi:hypothetical protein
MQKPQPAVDTQGSRDHLRVALKESAMPSFLLVVLGSVCAFGDPVPVAEECSYLYEPAYKMDCKLRGDPRSYLPQPGDIMVYTDSNIFWEITHDLAGAFQPHGSGVVVRKPDGSLGILEAGPNDCLHVKVLDMLPHLREYEAKGPVWIRKRKVPLTEEQSACLTEWAMRQEWKKFALIRLGGQLTILRSRGPLRTWFLGKPHGDRDGYFCSELVTETLVHVGLIDAKTARPAATYPHDLFFDHSFNLYLNTHFSLSSGWEPPARWVSKLPCECAK